MPNSELNTLELEFLFLTNFDLQVKRQTYDSYREELLAWNSGAASIAEGKSLVFEVRALSMKDRVTGKEETMVEEGGGGDDAMVID